MGVTVGQPQPGETPREGDHTVISTSSNISSGSAHRVLSTQQRPGRSKSNVIFVLCPQGYSDVIKRPVDLREMREFEQLLLHLLSTYVPGTTLNALHGLSRLFFITSI